MSKYVINIADVELQARPPTRITTTW